MEMGKKEKKENEKKGKSTHNLRGKNASLSFLGFAYAYI